jgi:hypothetical protein
MYLDLISNLVMGNIMVPVIDNHIDSIMSLIVPFLEKFFIGVKNGNWLEVTDKDNILYLGNVKFTDACRFFLSICGSVSVVISKLPAYKEWKDRNYAIKEKENTDKVNKDRFSKLFSHMSNKK